MDNLVAEVESDRAAAILARTASKENRAEQEQVVSEAKEHKRKLTRAFANLHDEGEVSDHVFDAVFKSGKLGRSPVIISGYFTDIRPHVEAHDASLARFFDGQSALSMLDSLKNRLDAVQAKQEAGLALLPLETRKVYQAMGKLLTLIEKLNRIGKNAFEGDALMMAKFNKDLLYRDRKRSRAKSKVESATGNTEGGAAQSM